MVAIFVLLSFLFILTVDHLVLKYQGKTHPAFEPEFTLLKPIVLHENSFNLPSGILLSKGHTWLKKETDGLIGVGVDILAAQSFGGLSIVECAEENSNIKRGDVLFVGNYGSEKVEILSPVSGQVKQVNQKIIGKKILKPFDTWGIKIHTTENLEKMGELFAGQIAINWLKAEFKKLKIFFEKNNANVELVGETMFDGGAAIENPKLMQSKSIINNFKNEFLSL